MSTYSTSQHHLEVYYPSRPREHPFVPPTDRSAQEVSAQFRKALVFSLVLPGNKPWTILWAGEQPDATSALMRREPLQYFRDKILGNESIRLDAVFYDGRNISDDLTEMDGWFLSNPDRINRLPSCVPLFRQRH